MLGIFEDELSPESCRLGIAENRSEIVFLRGGPSALENPVIGAALTGLELFTRSGDFQVLSRWLRSPFFVLAVGEAEARGMLETRLRSRISSQLIFREAFYAGGLEAKIRAELPALGEVLGEAAALMRSQPRQATPSHWAAVWRQLLSVLDWHGSADPGVDNGGLGIGPERTGAPDSHSGTDFRERHIAGTPGHSRAVSTPRHSSRLRRLRDLRF